MLNFLQERHFLWNKIAFLLNIQIEQSLSILTWPSFDLEKGLKNLTAHTGDHNGRYPLDTPPWFPVEIILYDPRKWYILSD